jgi:hypothetical protein
MKSELKTVGKIDSDNGFLNLAETLRESACFPFLVPLKVGTIIPFIGSLAIFRLGLSSLTKVLVVSACRIFVNLQYYPQTL